MPQKLPSLLLGLILLLRISAVYCQTPSLLPGDIAILGYVTNISSVNGCGSAYSTDDAIAFVTMVDIPVGTEILITDRGYTGFISGVHKFNNSEGIVRLTRSGTTLSKGSIFYVAFGSASAICGAGVGVCANGWTVSDVFGTSSGLDMNSTSGDQLFIMQGTFANATDFTGNFIYALTTTGVWSFNSSASSTTSNLPLTLDCLNMRITDTDKSRYNGSFATNTRSGHLVNIFNTTNWTASAPTMSPNCPTSSSFTFTQFPSSITVNDDPTASAGPDQIVCGTTATMAATGTGTWTLVAGSGDITSPNSPTTTITNLGVGDNIFRWTVGGASCTGIFQVRITRQIALTPSVSIVSDDADNSICEGADISFTASPTNAGTNPSYQWRINGLDVLGATGANFSPTTPLADGDIVSVVMTVTSAGCFTTTTVSSNNITLDVVPLTSPTVSIVPSIPMPICVGQSVSFNTNVGGGGTVSSYEWRVNGVLVAGATGASFTSSSLVNNDLVTVSIIMNGACLTSNNASANFTVLTSPTINPMVNISTTSAFPVCAGTSINFVATPTNGGTTPTYDWRVNGTSVGAPNLPSFSSTTLNNGDVVTVRMTTSLTGPCINTAPVSSAGITVGITPRLSPAVSISTTSTFPVCDTDVVSFTASPSNGGTTPSYQWQVNGANVGGNSATFTYTNPADNATIRVIMTTALECVTSPTAVSNAITVTTRDCRPRKPLFVPDLFTPNGDGQNDHFVISGDDIAQIRLRVYDRSGNLMYETSSVSDARNLGWDGKANGKEQPIGTYLWQLDGTFTNGQPLRYRERNRGVINLMR